MKRALKISAAAIVVAFLGAQFFQPDRSNPQVNPAASFEAVAKPHPGLVRALGRACADCHSNQTEWPWYSRVSPVSWVVASDVRRGRGYLNFSEWNWYSPEMSAIRLKEACQEVRSGGMPPWYYRSVHRAARLTPHETTLLCAGRAD